MSVCDRDCFHCQFPDCILDELEAEDYAEQRRIERDIVFPANAKQKKIAAKRRAYREANRDEIAAYQRAYREANREQYNSYMREYMRRKRMKNDVKEVSNESV